MEKVPAFIEGLDWNAYKTSWSKFWIKELGYDLNENGFAKAAVKLSIEESRKKDEILEENFLHFVKTHYSK